METVSVNEIEDDLTTAMLHLQQAASLLQKHGACECDWMSVTTAIEEIKYAWANEQRVVCRQSILAVLCAMNLSRIGDGDTPFVIDDTPRADTTA